jgi:hypothetical protein
MSFIHKAEFKRRFEVLALTQPLLLCFYLDK